MPFADVMLKPGVNVELTETANTAGYSASSLIRFKAGMAQKIGGWEKFYEFAVGGVPRDLLPWQTINGDKYLSAGSTTALSVIDESGGIDDITPTIHVTNVLLTFDTTAGSPIVTVHDASLADTVTTYDSVFFETPWSAGGTLLWGLYPIDLVAGATSYNITAATNATTTLALTVGGGVSVATVLDSAVVTVSLNAHGLAIGNTFVFQFPVTIAGITLDGAYTVNTVPSASTFTVSASSLANATVAATPINQVLGFAYARLSYYIALGPAATGVGYGLGTYGSGTYGLGTATAVQTGDPVTTDDWTQANWGSTLLACPGGGAIYSWTPGGGFSNAKLVSSGPIFNGGIFIAAPAQILIAWGSTAVQTIGVNQDPLLYKWSDQLDYEFWEPGVVNPSTGNLSQAGSARIPTGSRIVAGLQAPQQALLWTDLDLWSINYLGAPQQGLVFGQNKIASACGAIGSHAVGQIGNSVYWMGQSNFFVLSGNGVAPIPCSVWDAVFQDLDTTNAWKVRCCPNTPFNEVMWQYPSLSGGSGENDSYVKVNIVEGGEPVWDIGPMNTMARSAWVDQNVFGQPIGASPAGVIYSQETGENADGTPIEWSFTTGYWVIGDAEQVAFVDRVIPDFKYGTYNGTPDATVQITLYSVMYPGDTPREYGPYTFTASTQYLNPRLRGRQMAIKVSGADMDSFVRLGRVRFRWAPDGRY